MIDRVGNGTGYEYPKINDSKLNSGASQSGEKFQLDYEEKKKKSEEDGVKLSLSSTGYEQLEKAQKDSYEKLDFMKEATLKEDIAKENSFVKNVTEMVNKFLQTVKSIFQSIWNDSDVNKVPNNTDDVILEPVETEGKEYSEFDKLKQEATEFLNSAEGKKAARNTDLLTYYDKHGTVIHVNASDRQRILYGDKNQIEV